MNYSDSNIALNTDLDLNPILALKSPIKTTCPYCGVGCGITINKHNEGISVVGDKAHPANLGKLCIKGKNLDKTITNDHRLIQPIISGKSVSWARTLDYVASKFSSIIDQHGADSVAFYVSGQLLTEDYYVANKLMKGFIGSGNIDTNSRLCMSSAVAAHKRAFGEDIVPLSYSDIINSDLIILAGSNLAWCHPVIYQRIRDEKKRRPELKLVVIDPRKTASLELADLHLPIKAGGDLTLFNGLLSYLGDKNLVDKSLNGMADSLADAKMSANDLLSIGLSETQQNQFFEWFATNDKVVTVFSQGINQSRAGSDQGNAIINCHTATGKIGKEGSGPFSITGQPNAMGGREVGALANTLASHIEFDDTHMHEPLSNFWQTNNLAITPGLKAVDLFDAVDSGKIKAIWIMATNPAVSMPDNHKVTQALKKCDMVVVSDCVAINDTIELADVVLPAQGWGEKNGTVTNSERRISRQRSFLEPYGEAKPDWWVICEVAKRMGFAHAFSYDGPVDIFREHASLSGLCNEGSRGFDISSFDQITAKQYQQWLPKQWPQPKGKPYCLSDQRFFEKKHYYTANKQVNVVPTTSRLLIQTDPRALILNTGRNRDQWHTQTRSGKAPQLTNRNPEPLIDIHPVDANKYEISHEEIIIIEGNKQQIQVRCRVTNEVNEGEMFMPIHWSKNNADSGCVSKLIRNIVDPISGQPAFKQTPVTIAKQYYSSEALVLVKHALADGIADYQIKQQIKGGYCYHLASNLAPQIFFDKILTMIAPPNSNYLKRTKQDYYQAGYLNDNEMLAGCFVASKKHLLPMGWAGHFFDTLKFLEIKKDLMFEDVNQVKDKTTFCQCLNVNVGQLREAINAGAISLSKIREKTGAGNGCGSCIDDIIAQLATTNSPVKSR